MKQKIEITQSDLIKLLVEKTNFLLEEYHNLLSAYEFNSKKNKIITDPLKITESHHSFLSQHGDIQRILKIYEDFKIGEKPIKTQPKKEG